MFLLCTGAAALARPTRGGGSRRAAKQVSEVPDGPAPMWERDEEWKHKDLPTTEGKARRTGGRSRAARREEFYESLRDYSEHFAPLIQAEFEEEQQVSKMRWV